jgi:uncharacterized protein (TIGR04255 family)
MFGFKNVERKNYKNNFLKVILFQLHYDEINCKDKVQDIQSVLKENFPRFKASPGQGFRISFDNNLPNFQETKGEFNIDARSEDGQKVITISNNSILLTVNGAAYKSFQTTLNHFNEINSILEICQINKVNRVAVRKVNLLEFEINENPCDILNLLINPELIGNIAYAPSQQSINHYIQSLNYNNNDYFLNTKYGLSIPKQMESKIGQIIIDIDLYNQSKTPINNIINISQEINSEIFNVFNWVISDKFLELLNN